MKRFLSLALALILAFSFLTGCDNSDNNTKTRTRTTTTPSTTTTLSATTTAPTSTEDTSAISPMLWRVTGESGEVMYLFGTIHVGDKRNKTAMNLILDTVEVCDALAVEFDIVAYQKDMEAMIYDMAQYVYADGTKISDHLPEEMYTKAVSMMKEAKLYTSLLDRYNVAMWSQYIEQAAFSLYSDLDSDYGMDNMLLDKAYDDGMEILDVESGAFQMALLNSFSDELYILLIQSVFDHADTYGESLDELYNAWLSGDFEELTRLTLDEDFTGLTDEQIELVKNYNYKLLDERNIGMGDKAIEYLESGKTVFFAVGAAHMTGETGLVNRLAEEGYTVERVYLTTQNN